VTSLHGSIEASERESLCAIMSSTKRIQGKLFRGETGIETSDSTRSISDQNSLTIDIPKIAIPSVSPAPPPKNSKHQSQEGDVPASNGRSITPYRLRLLQRLADEYRGAEKYRLEQDNKKLAHWKRWGPYLSDRQWVCFWLLLYLHRHPFDSTDIFQ
jgi:hypothetical protein